MDTTTQLLKASCELETYKQSVKTLQDQLCNKEAVNKILFGMVCDYCTTFESKFMSDEDEFTPEQMQQYISASIYLEVRFARKGMHGKVKEKLGALPWGD
jgi:hypothetical protein